MPLRQRDRQRPDARSNLDDHIGRASGRLGHAVAQGSIGQEVLAQPVLGLDAVLSKEACQLVRVGGVDQVIRRNSRRALSLSRLASSSRVMPRRSATSSAVSIR